MIRLPVLDRSPGTLGERTLRGSKVFTAFILALALIVTFLYYPLSPVLSALDNAAAFASKAAIASSQPKSPHWPGWPSIKHMVVFGDSITSTRFNFRGEQPSKINPLGNPDFPGNTSAIGPNWVSFLTATHNTSFLKTVNLAAGGATVDGDIVSGMYPIVKSFKDQIGKWWLPNYVPPPSEFDWRAHDTLFVPFLGTNDVGRAFLNSWNSVLEIDVHQYASLLEVLYQSGARNFLVLKVLPLERAPFIERLNAESIRQLGELVEIFNNNLDRVVSEFRKTYLDATVFLFDTHTLFSQLMDDPCSYEETCPLQITTTYCRAYMHEENDPYRFDPECQYPIDEYFWLNTLHPSFRVHNATAKAISAFLSNAT